MARPIKETPILFEEDARRFEERMKEKRSETPEQREKRLKDYELAMKIFKKRQPVLFSSTLLTANKASR